MSTVALPASSEPYNPTLEYTARNICGRVFLSFIGPVAVLEAEVDMQNLTLLRPDGSREPVRFRELKNMPPVTRRSALAKRVTRLDTHGDNWVERSWWCAEPEELLSLLRESEMERVA